MPFRLRLHLRRDDMIQQLYHLLHLPVCLMRVCEQCLRPNSSRILFRKHLYAHRDDLLRQFYRLFHLPVRYICACELIL